MNKLLVVFFFFLFFKTAVGQTVTLITVDQLNERLSKGLDTTFVINFWATWCKPCKTELPFFVQLEKDNPTDKIKVFLVSVDFKSALKSQVIPYVKKIKKKDNLFLLDEKNEQAYIERIDKNWSGALPATIFIKGDKRRFFEKDFTYAELTAAYKNL